jgi:hypothetical protein
MRRGGEARTRFLSSFAFRFAFNSSSLRDFSLVAPRTVCWPVKRGPGARTWESVERRTFGGFGDAVAVAVFLSFQHLVEVPFVRDALELLETLCDQLFAFYLWHS